MKKLKKVFIMALAIISFSSVFAISASANNHSDTRETIGIASYSYSWTTAARYKEDMSYSYQKCVSTPQSYTSWVYGSTVNRPTNVQQCNGNLTKPGNSGMGTTRYTFTTGKVVYMNNWVRENNIPYAGMLFFGGTGSYYTASILWSPDSV